MLGQSSQTIVALRLATCRHYQALKYFFRFDRHAIKFYLVFLSIACFSVWIKTFSSHDDALFIASSCPGSIIRRAFEERIIHFNCQLIIYWNIVWSFLPLFLLSFTENRTYVPPSGYIRNHRQFNTVEGWQLQTSVNLSTECRWVLRFKQRIVLCYIKT